MVFLKQAVLAASTVALASAVDIHVRPGGGNVTGKVRPGGSLEHDFQTMLTSRSLGKSTHMASFTKISTTRETVAFMRS